MVMVETWCDTAEDNSGNHAVVVHSPLLLGNYKHDDRRPMGYGARATLVLVLGGLLVVGCYMPPNTQLQAEARAMGPSVCLLLWCCVYGNPSGTCAWHYAFSTWYNFMRQMGIGPELLWVRLLGGPPAMCV